MQCTSTVVALERCPDYESRQLENCINRLVSELDCPENLTSTRILLKPNLISGKAGPLPCTDGRFILATARYFMDRGAKVLLGDSPAFGTAHQVLAKLGILRSLEKLGVHVTDFSTVRSVTLPGGIRASLAVDALDCDLLVNLPRVKAHAQMRCTLAVKNYFGCLAGTRKAWWHMVHGGTAGSFPDLILELLTVLPPSLVFVDGVIAMHRTGPMHGEPYRLGLIGGANNPVAMDSALLALLGISPEESPLACAATRAKITGSTRGELLFPLCSPEELSVDDFLLPKDLDPIRFNPLHYCRSFLQRFFAQRSP